MNYNPKSYIPYDKEVIDTTPDDEIYVFSISLSNFGLILEYKTNALTKRYNKNFFDALCYLPSEIEFFCKTLNENKNTPIFTVGGRKHRLIIAFHNISAPICVAVVLSSPVEYACKSAVEFFSNSFLSEEVCRKAAKRKNIDFKTVSQISDKIFIFNNLAFPNCKGKSPDIELIVSKIKDIAIALCPKMKLTILRTFYEYNSERNIPTLFAEGYFSLFLICTLLSANRYAKQNEILIELFEENDHFGINLSFNVKNEIEFSYIPLIEKISSEVNLNFVYNCDFKKFTAKVTPFYTDIGLIGLKAPTI